MDLEVVMAAVSQNGNALQYAPSRFKANREVVTAACRSYSPALQHADAELASDENFILDLINNQVLLTFRNLLPFPQNLVIPFARQPGRRHCNRIASPDFQAVLKA